MGHTIGKDVYRKLGNKIDHLTVRVPWNETLYHILKALYSPQEADIIVKMPYSLSTLEQIAKSIRYEKTELHGALDDLCSKGLVIDLWIQDEYRYMPSPMVIGIFEFTMMRTGAHLETAEWARLFHEYMRGDDSFYAANYGTGEKVSIMRTLPHEETINRSEYIEILDYEKATSIVNQAKKFSIGLCSCRHEKHHTNDHKCDVPLDVCSSFGIAADYLIRHGLAREVSKSEMLENLARSQELALVLNADNVQRNITYICHCCKCCCNALAGISVHGYANAIITSSFLSEIDEAKCSGCGRCARACPIDAIEMVSIEHPRSKKVANPRIDTSICLGCGVCALKCNTDAARLVKRGKRVIPPETTFERVILQSLERGTLQNQIFDDPQSITQRAMRGLIGGFLRLPPVKRALMSDLLRSSFLASVKAGANLQGKGWLAEM